MNRAWKAYLLWTMGGAVLGSGIAALFAGVWYTNFQQSFDLLPPVTGKDS